MDRITSTDERMRDCVTLIYDSYSEFVEHTTDDERIFRDGEWENYDGARKANKLTHPGYMARVAHPNDHGWCAGMNWRETKSVLLCDGWPEGADRLRAIASEINGVIAGQTTAMDVHYDVTGESLDIGAYMAGEPECFMDLHEVQREGAGKIVSILVNNTSEMTVKTISYINRGSAILSLIDLLEGQGFRVELSAFVNIQNPFTRMSFSIVVPIKEANEPANVERIAFSMAHPAFSRRAMYNIADGQPVKYRRSLYQKSKGMGYAGCYPGVVRTPSDIVIWKTLMPDDFISFASCKDWIMYQLNKIGITLSGEAAVPG